MQFKVGQRIIKPGLPSIHRRAVNLMREVRTVVTKTVGGAQLVSDPEASARRKSICDSCKWMLPDAYAGAGGCSHPDCGCCMRIKRWIYSARCPEGKWL